MVVILLLYLRFLLRLPWETRRALLLAGFLYVGGALGFELLSGNQASVQGKDLTVELFVMAEEILEMSGVLILIYGLLSYIQTHLGGICLIFGDPSPDRAGRPG